MKFWIVVGFLIIAVIQFGSTKESLFSNAEKRNKNSVFFDVERVIDGDTLKLEKIGVVRLIGVDTPETVHPNKPVEYFGKEASKFLKDLLTGKKVRIEYDQSKKDHYNRTLGYIYLEDGTFVNETIIEKGFGHAYTSFPFKYMERYRALEKDARENNRGLWAEPVKEVEPKESEDKIGKYSCQIRKNCKQIKTCNEAMFLLNECGFSRLDGDKDGIPCEDKCGR